MKDNILENDKSVAQVARETGANTNTLYGWIKKYGDQLEVMAVQTFSTPEAELDKRCQAPSKLKYYRTEGLAFTPLNFRKVNGVLHRSILPY